MTVKWGLLSTARINRAVLAGAAESEQAEVIAVASRDAERAKTYAREHGIPRAYGSYQTLLDDSNVEAVYISLPNALHVEWTLRALEAGKHVLCEKPFSRRPEDVERASRSPSRSGSSCQRPSCADTTPRRRRLPCSPPRARSAG